MKLPETSNGACEELLKAFGQVRKLGDKAITLGMKMEKGETVAPQDMQKMGNQIKWRPSRAWKFTVVLLNKQDYYQDGRLIIHGRCC
jgi:hypothetical protein